VRDGGGRDDRLPDRASVEHQRPDPPARPGCAHRHVPGPQRCGQTEVGAGQPQRVQDLSAQHGAQVAAGDALHNLAEDEPVAQDVVGGCLAGRVPRPGVFQGPHRAGPAGRGQGVTPQAACHRDAGAVLQYLPDRDGVLAVAAEFRPVPGHRVIQPQLAALGEQVHQHGGERLASREQQEKRVRPAPERPVKDHLAIADDAGLCDRPVPLDQPGQTAQCFRINASVLPHPADTPAQRPPPTLRPFT
jgi:hypothetical protein